MGLPMELWCDGSVIGQSQSAERCVCSGIRSKRSSRRRRRRHRRHHHTAIYAATTAPTPVQIISFFPLLQWTRSALHLDFN